jgi:hypothetical protein
MPRAAKKKKDEIDPDGIYVAWQAGSCEVDRISYTVGSGERRRGSDPFVQAHPWLFVADGTPEAERPNAFHAIAERADAERPPQEHEIQLSGPVPQALEREDVIQLTRSVAIRAGHVAEREIVTFDKGTVFAARSEIAEKLPDDAYKAEPGVQFTRPKRRRGKR